MTNWPVYGEITGPIVMIGFGSIGRGTLPLLERHFKFDKSRFVVIAPDDSNRHLLDERGIDIPFPQRTLWFGQPKSGEAPPLTFTGRVRPAPGAAPRREEHGGEDQVAAVRTPAETLDVPRSPEHEHG